MCIRDRIQSLGENESEADIYAAFARGNLGKAIHLAQSEEFGVMHREMLHLLRQIKDTDISELLDYIRERCGRERAGHDQCLQTLGCRYIKQQRSGCICPLSFRPVFMLP